MCWGEKTKIMISRDNDLGGQEVRQHWKGRVRYTTPWSQSKATRIGEDPGMENPNGGKGGPPLGPRTDTGGRHQGDDFQAKLLRIVRPKDIS